MRSVTFLSALAALAALWACSGNTDVGSRFIKSLEVSAQQEATLSVTASDSAELAGAALSIPASAAGEDVKITLEQGNTSLVAGVDQAGSVPALWGPSGFVFQRDVSVTLPLSGPAAAADATLYVAVVEADGTQTTIEAPSLKIDRAAGTVTFFTTHLASNQVLVHGCNSATVCAGGTTCNSTGACNLQPCSNTAGTVQCPAGTACASDGYCHPTTNTCNSAGGCPPGYVCTNTGTCQPYTPPGCSNTDPTGGCPPGYVCSTTGCVPSNTPCSATTPCSTGKVCVNGVCRTTCTNTTNCPDPTQQCSAAGICY